MQRIVLGVEITTDAARQSVGELQAVLKQLSDEQDRKSVV